MGPAIQQMAQPQPARSSAPLVVGQTETKTCDVRGLEIKNVLRHCVPGAWGNSALGGRGRASAEDGFDPPASGL